MEKHPLAFRQFSTHGNRCGTWVVLEFESLKKISSEKYSFSFPLETVFKVRSPSLDPGAVEGNSAGLRRLHGLGKRNAPGGRAPPPRTNPERASNFWGVSCCRFRRSFERLKHLRFGGSLSFICETGNPTASWWSMHFRGSFAEVAPGRPEHFSTAVHGACEVLYCRLQLFQGETSVD